VAGIASLERPLTTRRVARIGRQRAGRKQQDECTCHAPSEHGIGKINLLLPHAE
jgi:hypothetical protein